MSGKPKRRKGRTVDMSVPPEERRRRRQGGAVGGTPPAQLSHAGSSTARRQRRYGERWLEGERRVREAVSPGQGGDPGA